MTGRTHVVGGIASLWLLQFIPTALLPEGDIMSRLGMLAGVAALGALLPDLDAHDSKLQRLSVGGIAPFVLPARLLHHALGHRGLLHSALGLCLVVLLFGPPLAAFLGWQAPFALLLGYASHLLLDGCTRSGIPLRYPNRRRWHALPLSLRLVTSSPEEEIVFALLAALALGLLVSFLSP